jgi:hypothetical protein
MCGETPKGTCVGSRGETRGVAGGKTHTMWLECTVPPTHVSYLTHVVPDTYGTPTHVSYLTYTMWLKAFQGLRASERQRRSLKGL